MLIPISGETSFLIKADGLLIVLRLYETILVWFVRSDAGCRTWVD